MDAIATQFFEAADAAADIVESDAVGARWGAPSLLPGYDVGALAAHLARAVHTVESYLAAEPPGSGSPRLTAGEYFAAALGDHDPVDSELHAQVRRRGEDAAATGQRSVIDSLRTTIRGLRDTDLDLGRPIAVIGGLVMLLGDYLQTRLVELAVHSADLAESVGVAAPRYESPVWDTVANVVVATGLARSGPRALALGLARAERHGPFEAFG